MRVEIIDSEAALEASISKWLEFVESGVSGHRIHNDPRLIQIRLASDPTIQLRIVMIREGNKLLAIAPFYIRKSNFNIQFSIWRVPVGRARVLRLFGDSVIISEAANQQTCVRALSDFLLSNRKDIDYFEVHVLDPESPFWQEALAAWSALGAPKWRRIDMRNDLNHRVALAKDFGTFLTQFGKHTRKIFRQSARRLAERSAELEIFTGLEQVPELLRCMHEVYADAWQGKAMSQVADVSSNRLQYIQGIAMRGWLRSYVIRLAGQPVAFDHGYLHESTYYSMEAAYRQDARKLSPGTVLSLWSIEDLHQNSNVREIDLGPGDLPYKRVIGNVTIPIRSVCFSTRLRWQWALKLQISISWAYDRARATIVKIGLAEWIRRVIKKKAVPA